MAEADILLSSYQYELPEERIAQNPVVPRDRSRLLVVDGLETHQHSIFHDLPNWLLPGDLLILNNTRVIPARLFGRKPSGAMVEVLLLSEESSNRWLALVRPGKRLKPGALIEFPPLAVGETTQTPLKAWVLATDPGTGGRILEFEVPGGGDLLPILDQFGQIPFPPYVTESEAEPHQYQTIYAETPGAVAAPTAGLHFTDELFEKLAEKGIQKAFITLHVGVGTFRPVEVEDITSHEMHKEWIEVPETTVTQIQQTKAQGGRVIAVGTTAVRALEGAAALTPEGQDFLIPYWGHTDLFIYPGYQWRVVDGMITNFHLPGSSLLMLVSAMIGRRRLLGLYEKAIEQKYRFYSFGDAMLILPQARL